MIKKINSLLRNYYSMQESARRFQFKKQMNEHNYQL